MKYEVGMKKTVTSAFVVVVEADSEEEAASKATKAVIQLEDENPIYEEEWVDEVEAEWAEPYDPELRGREQYLKQVG